MSTHQMSFINETVEETNIWLKEISEALHDEDRQKAYHALRGVLFAIRDRIPPQETLDFASQLPMLVRGIFFEGYDTRNKPEKYRNLDEFYDKVNKEYKSGGGENPQMAADAVFEVMKHHITGGQMNHIFASLPQDIASRFQH